jgi:hypothetical protein
MPVTAGQTSSARVPVTGWPRRTVARLRALAGRNKLFAWALAAGAVLRLVAMLGYPGALWFAGDSYVYIGAALRPQPNLSKSTGYSLFLRALLPFHSLTLVTGLQHLMGLAVAVMIYALLRRNGVSRVWSTVATLPVLLDGYLIEDEHLIMAEALFTFLIMVAMLLLWRGQVSWWVALIAGLLVGYAVTVRTEGLPVLVLFLLALLVRGLRNGGWRNGRGWLATAALTVGAVLPVAAYAGWFHSFSHNYGLTRSTGFYLWGRVSSFADCSRISAPADEMKVCPTQPLSERTPPGNFVWHAPQVHKNLPGSPVSAANNTLLTNFALHAIESQPLDYAKTVVKDVMLSFGFPRIDYPGAGTVYYYSFHLHYKTATYSTLPPDNLNHEWIPGGTAYQDWLSYGHQAPGVVDKVFAAPILGYERLVFTYGPLFGLILLTGLGGAIRIRRPVRVALRPRPFPLYWERRGTSPLPWITAVVLLVAPIAVADFDYRYLLPVLPFACLAAGLAFAPARKNDAPEQPPASDQMETAVPGSVA